MHKEPEFKEDGRMIFRFDIPKEEKEAEDCITKYSAIGYSVFFLEEDKTLVVIVVRSKRPLTVEETTRALQTW